MGKRFLEGVTFGAGFGLAFLLVLWLGLSFFITKAPDRTGVSFSTLKPAEKSPEESGPPFHELAIEEQIKKSSVIALARYETAQDGKKKAILKEFLKKEPGTTIYYNIGDEYPEGSYYPTEGRGDNENLIIFFTGSPASMKMSTTFSGDRIRSLGDIPLELFRSKCEPDA
jgi:hypothetical protein